jgi:hypothetical protein
MVWSRLLAAPGDAILPAFIQVCLHVVRHILLILMCLEDVPVEQLFFGEEFAADRADVQFLERSSHDVGLVHDDNASNEITNPNITFIELKIHRLHAISGKYSQR